MKVIMLIKCVSEEHATWGVPKISDELALLGHVDADLRRPASL